MEHWFWQHLWYFMSDTNFLIASKSNDFFTVSRNINWFLPFLTFIYQNTVDGPIYEMKFFFIKTESRENLFFGEKTFFCALFFKQILSFHRPSVFCCTHLGVKNYWTLLHMECWPGIQYRSVVSSWSILLIIYRTRKSLFIRAWYSALDDNALVDILGKEHSRYCIITVLDFLF